MTDNKYNATSSRVVFGLLLIFLGLLFLLTSLDFINVSVPHIIFSWPGIITLIGIILLIKSSKKLLGGLITAFGLILLLPRFIHGLYYDEGIFFPVLIILFGVYIIFRRRTFQRGASTISGGPGQIEANKIDDVAIFGGGGKTITSDNFEGGSITAIFGGTEIDLTTCKLAPGNVIIDVVAIFGGCTIIVPQEWSVTIDVFPLFGGFGNKIRRTPNVEIDTSRRLIIKGIVIFGGGEVKTRFGVI